MGQYADLYLKAHQELRPKEYARRKGSPEFRRETQAAEERATVQEQNAMRNLLLQHPEPADYPSRVQHLRALQSQARELAQADLLDGVQPESPAHAESSSDSPPPATTR